MALFWNLISSPLWFVIPGEMLQKGNRLALFGLLFPLVGLGLAAWALYTVLQRRKYGQSVLQMAAVPGVLGGELAGVVRTAAHIQPEAGFHVSLSCIQQTTSGSGDNRSTHAEILWQDEQVIVRQLGQSDADPSAIPVLFAIPYNCRPTDDANSDNQTIWRLKVAAAVPGIDYAAAFDVPVFKTPQSDPHFARTPPPSPNIPPPRTPSAACARPPSSKACRPRARVLCSSFHGDATWAAPSFSRCFSWCGPARSW